MYSTINRVAAEDDRSAIDFGRDLSSGLRKALIVDQVCLHIGLG